MIQFQVTPIDARIAAQVRDTLKDPIYGLPLHVEPAAGYGPCRLCLRTFQAGEPRILFLYNPFSAEQDADFAGPVFIHARACERFEAQGFPKDVARLPIVLKAYDRHQRCIAERLAGERDLRDILDELLDRAETEYVHVRNAEAKCFIARVERVHQANVLVSSR